MRDLAQAKFSVVVASYGATRASTTAPSPGTWNG